MSNNKQIEIETGSNPTGSIIWLHGLGADGHDFEPIVPELNLDGVRSLRFIFPHAPVRSVTINGGMSMRAWYDILTLDRDGPQDDAGILDSHDRLLALIERECERGIEAKHIVLAGFSQGGAIASFTAVKHPQPLGGLMALSTYVPLHSRLADDLQDTDQSQTRSLPIFMAHGTADPVLPIELGKQSEQFLQQAGFSVDWHEYPMAHGVCPQEIADIRQWLQSVFA